MTGIVSTVIRQRTQLAQQKPLHKAPKWPSHKPSHKHSKQLKQSSHQQLFRQQSLHQQSKQTHFDQARLVQTHLAILKLGVSIWNQWRASEPLTSPNLQRADLRGLHLENINLCRANLRGANLRGTYCYDADFQYADLRGASLTRAGLIGANLHKADLTGAVVKQAYLAQSDLSNAKFIRANMQSADFQGALLTQAVLTDAEIAEADFSASFDLTLSQLKVTKDAHLACLSPDLKTQLEMMPVIAKLVVPSPVATFTKPVAAISQIDNPAAQASRSRAAAPAKSALAIDSQFGIVSLG